tara:strand:+ start:2811 stop:3008 length:198 start_codon:yes stop_codon:yes gene_type:complete
MIKVGDRVAPFHNMTQKGIVTDMFHQKSSQWMIGGAMEPLFIIRVKLDENGEVVEFRADDLMRLD